MSPKETMSIAQKLYEKGKITYMRTDSLVLSLEAHHAIKDKVIKEFGKEYYQQNIGNEKKDKVVKIVRKHTKHVGLLILKYLL